MSVQSATLAYRVSSPPREVRWVVRMGGDCSDLSRMKNASVPGHGYTRDIHALFVFPRSLLAPALTPPHHVYFTKHPVRDVTFEAIRTLHPN